MFNSSNAEHNWDLGLADERLGDTQGTLLLFKLLIEDHLADPFITLHDAAFTRQLGRNLQASIETHRKLTF